MEEFALTFEQEKRRREVELSHKMAENTDKQIQCYVNEMEYLYKNDPTSIIEDADR